MEDTKQGIRVMMFVFILAVVSSAIVLAGIGGISGSTGLSYSGSAEVLSGIMCYAGFFALIGFALFLYAVFKIYTDAEQFSSEHKRNVTIAIVLYLLGGLLGSGIPPLQALLYSAAAVLLVKDIAGEIDTKLLYSAAGVNVLSATGQFIFIVMITTLRDQEILIFLTWVLGSLITSYGIFILAYHRVHKSLERGEGRSKESSEEWTSRLTQGESLEDEESCPRCGAILKVYRDGSAICDNCGFSTSDWEGNRGEATERGEKDE